MLSEKFCKSKHTNNISKKKKTLDSIIFYFILLLKN